MADKTDWSNILGLPKIRIEDKERTEFGRLARAQELRAEGLLNSKVVEIMREEGYSISPNALRKWEKQGLLEKKSETAIALIKEMCQQGASLDDVYSAVQEKVSDNYHKQLIAVWYNKYCPEPKKTDAIETRVADVVIFSLLQALSGTPMDEQGFESAIETPLMQGSSFDSTPLALAANVLPPDAIDAAIFEAKHINNMIQDLAVVLTGHRSEDGFDSYLKRLTKPLVKNTSFTPLYLMHALFPDLTQSSIHNIARGGIKEAAEEIAEITSPKEAETLPIDSTAKIKELAEAIKYEDMAKVAEVAKTLGEAIKLEKGQVVFHAEEFSAQDLKYLAKAAGLNLEEELYTRFNNDMRDKLVKHGLFSFSEYLRSWWRWPSREEIAIARKAWDAIATDQKYLSYRNHILIWPKVENVGKLSGGFLMAQLEIHTAMEGRGFLTLSQIMENIRPKATGISSEIVATELINLTSSRRARVRGDYDIKLASSRRQHIESSEFMRQLAGSLSTLDEPSFTEMLINLASAGGEATQEMLNKFGDWNTLQFKLEKSGYEKIITSLKALPAFGLPQLRDIPRLNRSDPCVCGSGKKFKKCCQSLYNEVL